MKCLSYLILILLALTWVSCEEEISTPDTITASQGTYIGVVQLSYQPVSGDGDVRYVGYRMNPDNMVWNEIGWTSQTEWADEGYMLSSNKIIPGQRYDYRMRAHTDEAGFSDYSPVVTGYAFEAEPIKISSIERNEDGGNLEITVKWSDPNDLHSLQNLQEVNYELHRKEKDDYNDFQEVGSMQFLYDPYDEFTDLSITDDSWGLENNKTYIYKVVAKYEYDYTTVNGDYRYNSYIIDGDTTSSEDSGLNPGVDYSITELGQVLSASQGGIPQLKEKVVGSDLYMGAITDAGATAYGTPMLYRYNGSSWEQIFSNGPGTEYDEIHYAVTSSHYYLGGTGDSLSVFAWGGSDWSENLTPDNLGQEDSPSEVSLASFNDELYMAIEQHPDYNLQVLKYTGSAWDTIGGDANGIIATGTTYNAEIEYIDGTLYLKYVTDNSAHVKRWNGSSWSDVLNWTHEYIGDIQLAQNGGDLYFIVTSNSLANFPGGVYKVTGTSTTEALVQSDAEWFLDPMAITVDSDGNVVVTSIKYESQESIYPFINIYDGTTWKTINDDFTTGMSPVTVSAINTDIFYMYGDASSGDMNGYPTAIQSKKYSK